MNNLQRFIEAQDVWMPTVVEELCNFKKVTHWIWFIFPQLKGLGTSFNSVYYGLDGVDETIAYLENDILKKNLLDCCYLLLRMDCENITDVVGEIDRLKIQSSMTLFYLISKEKKFKEVLDKYYGGKLDIVTEKIINENK